MNTQDDKWPPVYYALPENQISFEGFLINLRAYVAAIDWTEPWLVCVLLFHVLIFFVIISVRKNTNILCAFTFGLMALALLLQPINTLASHYWNYFARQNYFDKNGLFVTAIFAFPALCNITLGICLILIEVLHLLRRVKVAQLKRKRTQTLSIQSKEDKEQHEQPLSAQVKKDQ